MKIHHIGYLVKKIDRAIHGFIKLSYEKESEIVYDEYRGVDICFMVKDKYRIELVSPRDEKSVVYQLQKKMGNTPYHICYICKDIESAIDEMKAQGFVEIDEPHDAVAIGRKLVCFLMHPYLGMIELLEDKE